MRDLQRALDAVSEAADDGTTPPRPALLVFRVPGDPTAKGRPRVSAVGGFARAYTPAKTRAYEAVVCHHATIARDDASWDMEDAGHPFPWSGPLRVELVAVFKRPGRLFRKADPAGRILHDKRPDLDNVVKAILDGMDKAGVWGDDAQVCEIDARKVYGAIVGERREKTSEPAGVFVTVRRIGDGAT